MKQTWKLFKLTVLCVTLQLAVCATSNAHTYFLTNGNSGVTIHADDNFGMGEWTVDGQTQLHRQQFWYRNGNSGGERPISDLALISENQPANNLLDVVYGNNLFSIELNYTLAGGVEGSSYATIGEQIKITNISNNPLDFHFFQYVDFDLGGNHEGDTLYLSRNLQGLIDAAYQTKGNFYFADEIISPGANHGQVDELSSGFVLLHSLNNNSPTTLNDNDGPVTGDTAWAIQWDVNIPVGGYFQISISKSAYVVPEPSAFAVFAVGAVLAAAVRRRPRAEN